MGYEYYTPKTASPEGEYKVRSTKKKAKVFCMTPMDMVQEFAKVTGQEPDHRLYEKLILEEYDEWCEAFELEEELKELSDLVYVIFGYANAMGWDLMEAVRRVHVNNLGRCVQPCSNCDGSGVINKYSTWEGSCPSCEGEGGTVQRRADGKILKREDYPKVDLGDLV